jgi:hypothetical protein
MEATARTTKSPWTLIRNAAGPATVWPRKLKDLTRALAAYGDGAGLDERLERLRALGYIERVPTRLQLVVGAIDMLRFWISPAADDYYRSRGIGFAFHQLLRVLDDPSSMVDPTGFLSTRDNIIGHLMQIVHANPAYDLQLLESHEGGLEELERQIEAMLEGTHARAASIGAIVEEPDYHPRLLRYVRDYRVNRDADAPLRDNVAKDPHWQRLVRTFGTLPSAMAYFANLPDAPLAAAIHLLTVRDFPHHLSPASEPRGPEAPHQAREPLAPALSA